MTFSHSRSLGMMLFDSFLIVILKNYFCSDATVEVVAQVIVLRSFVGNMFNIGHAEVSHS